MCPSVSRSEHRQQGDKERGRSKERCHLLSPDESRCNSEERSLQPSRPSSAERAQPPDKQVRNKKPAKATILSNYCLSAEIHVFFTVVCFLLVSLKWNSIVPRKANNLDSCFQGNSSDSPVPSTSESSTPSGRRPSSHTPTHSRPHISYSPLVCRTHPSVGEDEEETPDSMETEHESTQRPSPPRRYPSEPFLVSQEDDHSPDPSGPMETLTFEAAVACSLGRSNTISSARPRSRSGWQVPNGHFRKRLAQTVSVAGCDTLSDTEEDDRC